MMQIIGEKINIITKYIAKAIEEKDAKPIQELAEAQVKAGAHYLDVNIGPARKSGPEVMEWLVRIIQEVVDVPLSLDTTNHEAIEAGLKVHRGKAIINSTSAARGRMEKVFPLAAKYNASVIGLALGERGMPKDTEERCNLAMEVIMGAAEFGVNAEEIYLDPIVLTVNGMQEHAMNILEAVEMFKALNDPPMKTVAGLSNISNGCPEEMRSILNRTYLVMALQRGLDAAILDPLDERLMELLHQAEAMRDNIILEDILNQDELKTVEVFRGNILYCHSYLET
jgi:5-methyltetrahydrofolate corrinoid/iron sulfur protein methyltransferase